MVTALISGSFSLTGVIMKVVSPLFSVVFVDIFEEGHYSPVLSPCNILEGHYSPVNTVILGGAFGHFPSVNTVSHAYRDG